MCVLVCIGLCVYLYLYTSIRVCVYEYVFTRVGVREGVHEYMCMCGIYSCGQRSVDVWSVYSCVCVSVCLLCAYLCVCMCALCMSVCVCVCYRRQINRSEAELIIQVLFMCYGSYYLDSACDF